MTTINFEKGRVNHFAPNLLDLFLSVWDNIIEFHQRMETH